jgi:hypothetical protein
MSNELHTAKVLLCPADTNRVAASNWASFTAANLSYDYLSPSATNAVSDEPMRVLLRCPLHGHIGLCDGSVQGEVARKHPEWLVERDGKLYYELAHLPDHEDTICSLDCFRFDVRTCDRGCPIQGRYLATCATNDNNSSIKGKRHPEFATCAST